jgi:hypothetical protein
MIETSELLCESCTAYLNAVDEDGNLHRALVDLDSTLCPVCLARLRARIDDALDEPVDDEVVE